MLAVARAGAEVGCHEALFTLGEAPEDRYPQARDWLAEHGFGSTVAYVVHAARVVLEETGLLPHVNAGAISREELAMLRSVSPSQGMMIESVNPDLPAHRGAPDKDPQRRLETLRWAGELAIPFTTGLLVGIGETRSDRVATLEAIAASHAETLRRAVSMTLSMPSSWHARSFRRAFMFRLRRTWSMIRASCSTRASTTSAASRRSPLTT